MSHCLHAFICKKEELKVIPEKFIELPQGFVLFDSLPGYNDDNDDEDEEFDITNIANNICVIDTDYFGGAGQQSAKLWIDGKKVKIPDQDWAFQDLLYQIHLLRYHI